MLFVPWRILGRGLWHSHVMVWSGSPFALLVTTLEQIIEDSYSRSWKCFKSPPNVIKSHLMQHRNKVNHFYCELFCICGNWSVFVVFLCKLSCFAEDIIPAKGNRTHGELGLPVEKSALWETELVVKCCWSRRGLLSLACANLLKLSHLKMAMEIRSSVQASISLE